MMLTSPSSADEGRSKEAIVLHVARLYAMVTQDIVQAQRLVFTMRTLRKILDAIEHSAAGSNPK